MQKQKKDQTRQQNALAHILPGVVHHGAGKGAVIGNPHQFHTAGKLFFQFRQSPLDAVNDLYRIGLGPFYDPDGDGLAAVHIGSLTLLFGGHTHLGHVFDVGALTVFTRNFHAADKRQVFVVRVKLNRILGAVGANTPGGNDAQSFLDRLDQVE
ncbi:MAG: hypothetical protein BWX80_04010 [Candidatus Hydrogenedentes bacterium ADurb.Bin101]|nr:MAG: hypothetical protein BWX80_04010 [Candidatus Hydrogenedentes bacterium ADurb.Bin101]